ncbi:MAG: FAD-dependent oxidoreductase [Acidobacteriota bacterium]
MYATDLLDSLPDHLRERSSTTVDRDTGEGFVLYWMRTAVRGHENPALDVAFAIGEVLDRPVFVYHALSERYPYASDRLHMFVLEGARDVSAELTERGIGYAFHLERPGHRGPHLMTLAQRAGVVVTENMPVPPLSEWTRRLTTDIDRPVLLVDTACIVPMMSTEKAYDRAFAFRKATAATRDRAVTKAWPESSVPREPFIPADLPFSPINLESADLGALVAACEIDHGVAPVPHSRGGSVAGYARWNAFLDGPGLKRYARDRNDPTKNGTSRMSPYLHFGHVSPFRLAREAVTRGGAGAEKYLDELLVWRELAYHFCHHQTRRHHQADPGQLDDLAILPPWARESLTAHANDPRPLDLSWENLARGRSGDALWDTAQTSLLIHGELHNNVRMTWGKAVLGWTKTPDRALEHVIDLNHRYALDGRDPASYGGILWCFGAFDRPFEPAKPVLGRIRPRSTTSHARRLNLDLWSRTIRRPAHDSPPRVAVVGAGIAGLAGARCLADHGLEVVVFDKGRGPGGRASTRRAQGPQGTLTFDHGAQYFSARDPRFARFVESWHHDGVVAPWRGRFVTIDDGTIVPRHDEHPRWVGVPGMNAVLAHLATDLDVRWSTRVDRLTRHGSTWQLTTHDGDQDDFDVVLIATPALQAAALLREPAPHIASRLDHVEMAPCWAVMVAWDQPLDVDFDAGFIHQGPLSWVAANRSKPGRSQHETWVLHASPEWTSEHIEDPPETVAEQLLDAFARILDRRLPSPNHLVAHRWRYARTLEPLGDAALWDPASNLGCCGDWCHGAKIEAAWLSGAALAGRLLTHGHTTAPDRSATDQLSLFPPS